MLDRLLSLLAPHRCLGCGVVGSLLCSTCSASTLVSAPSRCYRCHKATQQFQVCHTCRPAVQLQHVWVASMYEALAKYVLQALKFHRARAAAKDIAHCLDSQLPILPKETLVCHIPTAHSRIRQRGYDQSLLIARELARLRGHEHAPLLRRVSASRQLGASREQRFKQAKSAFEIYKVPDGAHVLLIDDVTTSGATLEAAAKLLKAAGAQKVDACVFAQALD